jgi:hypothetical protein
MFRHHYISEQIEPIRRDTDFDVIPFGHRCTSALACSFASLRKTSLPFDWVIPAHADIIMKILKNDFTDFIPADIRDGNMVNSYGISLAHFPKDIEEGISAYNRRIRRFKKIMENGKRKYFVYMNEDYLYRAKYRHPKANHKNFMDMLELETYLRQRYANLDYRILYFDFVEREVPLNSCILHVTITTDQLFDNPQGSTKELLRIYLGKVMSEIFVTEFTGDLNSYQIND